MTRLSPVDKRIFFSMILHEDIDGTISFESYPKIMDTCVPTMENCTQGQFDFSNLSA